MDDIVYAEAEIVGRGGGEITTVLFCIKTTLIRDGSFYDLDLQTYLLPPHTHPNHSQRAESNGIHLVNPA